MTRPWLRRGRAWRRERSSSTAAKYTRKWDFSKLVGIVNYSDQPASAIQVSNRHKTSGIVYRCLAPDPVRLRLAVAAEITGLFSGGEPDDGKDAAP